MHDWVVWCKSKDGAEEIRSFELSRKEIFSNYYETKSKKGRNKTNKRKKKVYRGQSVRYRSWWKQGNIKMAGSDSERGSRSESCWVHKDFTVTKKKIHALLVAVRASSGKDECLVRRTGVEREYCKGTDISRKSGHGFEGKVTAADGVKMGAGYVHLRRNKKRKGTRRGKIQLESFWTSGLDFGITRHPYDKTHALLVQQPSAAEGCKKMDRRRRKSVSRSTRCRYLIRGNHRAPKKDNSRSSDFSGQNESTSRLGWEPANDGSDIQADTAIWGEDAPMSHDWRWAIFLHVHQAFWAWCRSRFLQRICSYLLQSWSSRIPTLEQLIWAHRWCFRAAHFLLFLCGCKEEHVVTECQRLGHRAKAETGWQTGKLQGLEPTHFLYFSCLHLVCHVPKTLPLIYWVLRVWAFISTFLL